MQEAKKRNPGIMKLIINVWLKQIALKKIDILLYTLAWGAPGWIGNGTYYSMDSILSVLCISYFSNHFSLPLEGDIVKFSLTEYIF
jgi:hypothetical protein